MKLNAMSRNVDVNQTVNAKKVNANVKTAAVVHAHATIQSVLDANARETVNVLTNVSVDDN